MDADADEDASPCFAQFWFMIEPDGVSLEAGAYKGRQVVFYVPYMVCTVAPHQLYKFVMDCMINPYLKGCSWLAVAGRESFLLLFLWVLEAESAVSNQDGGGEVSRSDESGLPAVW